MANSSPRKPYIEFIVITFLVMTVAPFFFYFAVESYFRGFRDFEIAFYHVGNAWAGFPFNIACYLAFSFLLLAIIRRLKNFFPVLIFTFFSGLCFYIIIPFLMPLYSLQNDVVVVMFTTLLFGLLCGTIAGYYYANKRGFLGEKMAVEAEDEDSANVKRPEGAEGI